MRACIQECQNCHNVCTETIAHCLEMGGDHAEPNHIRLLLDCAEICQTSANFMLRMSEFHGQTCGVCAEVCERCAEDCERFGDDQINVHSVGLIGVTTINVLGGDPTASDEVVINGTLAADAITYAPTAVDAATPNRRHGSFRGRERTCVYTYGHDRRTLLEGVEVGAFHQDPPRSDGEVLE